MTVGAIYARKSNKEKHATREVLSTTRQIEQARAYAAGKGWVVDERHIYRDEAITGAEFVKRQQFNRLLTAVGDAHHPPFDVLIIWERERLGRDLFRGPSTLHDIWEAGVKIFCFATDEEIKFDTPEEGLVEQIHGYRAEAEIRKVRERVLSVRTDKLGRGHVVGSHLYGYLNVAYYSHAGCTGHVERAGCQHRSRCPVAPERGEKRARVLREIEPAEAAIVRRIFALRASGDGYKTIGKTLNDEGVKSPSGKTWGKAVIRMVLHREHYRGVLVDGKTKWVRRRGTKIKLQCPASEWTQYHAPGPAIISDELWAAVQRADGISRVQSRRGPSEPSAGQPDREPYLLTGFTQCAACGHSLTIKKHPRSGRPVYKCSWNNERGQRGCANGTSVPVQAAEEAVLNTLLCDVLESGVIIRHLDAVRERALEEAAKPAGAVEREHLSAEIQRLDREIGNLVALAAQGSPAVLQGIMAREAERAERQSQLDHLTPTVPDLDLGALDTVLREQFDDWHRYWLSRDAIPLARQVLKQLLAGKLIFTIERGAASFTGEINLHPVLNRAVKRISSDRDPEPAFQAKDLPVDWLLSDGPLDPEQHRGIFSEGGGAPLRVH